MTFSDLLRKSNKILSDNSPAILTGIGVAGTVTTAILAGKASFKAAEMIRNEYDNRIEDAGGINGDWEPMAPMEKTRLIWTLYIPSGGTAILTIAAIIFANRIGTRRAAGLAAAYSLSEKAFEEYREKIVEKMGAPKEMAARDEIAQQHVDDNPASSSQIIVTGKGKVRCYEDFTGRYFMSTIEDMKKAQNDINYRVNNHNYASLTDFYDLINLPRTRQSDDIGWNADKLLELTFTAVIGEDDEPCIVVTYFTSPIRDYHRLY